MKKRPMVVLCAALPLLSHSSIVAAQSVRQWQGELDQAKRAVVVGDIDAAIDHYQRAATVSPNDNETAEIMFELGSLYGRKDLQNSAQAFCQAKDLAGGELRLQAGNNCATQLMRMSNEQQALDLMQDLWSEFHDAELSPLARSRVLYNYALALERNGRYDNAKEYYLQSFDADPGFEPVTQAISRYALSSRSESTGIPELVGLINGLIVNGKFDSAAEQLRQGLVAPHWLGHQEYPRLITQLTRYFAAAQVTPARFEAEWLSDLQATASNLPREDATRLTDIERSYFGNIEVEFDFWGSRGKFSAWRDLPDGYASLSSLMKMLGDQHFRRGTDKQALAFYVNAWTMDTTNMDAGLYTANLLASNEDLQGRYLNDFLGYAFGGKEQAYLGSDWMSILRFHTVLGSLFEKMKDWGPEWDARSAIFQWQHALSASQEIASRDPDYLRSTASIREHLAVSYAGDRQWQKAWREYIAAAEEHVKSGTLEEARRILGQAKISLPDADVATREQIARIERML